MVKTKGAKKLQWDHVRSDLQRMLDQGMKLKDIRDRLMATKNFTASVRSYRSKIDEWGMKKRSTSQTSAKRNSSALTSNTVKSRGPATFTSSFGGKSSDVTNNEHSSGSRIPNATAFPGPWAMIPEIQHPSGASAAAGFYSDPLEALWHVMGCIAQRNVDGLRMVIDITLANATVPALAAHPELSRYSGGSLLNWAIATSSVEVVEALLDAGADINSPSYTSSCHTPLMEAVTCNATSIVRLLLMRGASTEPVSANGQRALSIAAHCAQDPQIVEWVLRATLPFPWNDRLSALDLALSRRKREYGGPNHASTTCVVRILLTADRTTVAHSRSFFEPWTEHRNWVSLINEDEQKSVVHLIGHGAELHQSFAPPQVHAGANLAHTLLYHCWEVDMPKFLARNLGTEFPKSVAGEELLRTLAGGSTGKCCHGNRNAEAMSAFLENGVAPEGQQKIFNRTPLVLWILSLTRSAKRTRIENALPSLAVLLKWGANPNRKIETYPIENLLKQEWIHRFPDLAINVLEMLLSHFPNDTNLKPEWQCAPFFPITEDFGTYDQDRSQVFKELTKKRISDNSSDLLFKALYVVSARKFLASQLSTSKELRAYDKIPLVLKKLRNLDVSLDGFPTSFFLDTIEGLATLSEQTHEFSHWPYTSGMMDGCL